MQGLLKKFLSNNKFGVGGIKMLKWRFLVAACSLVRNDLDNLYLLSYYPLPNPNRGWREISVRLAGAKFRNLTVRTRSGYRPLPAQVRVAAAPNE